MEHIDLNEDDLNEEMPRKNPQNALSRWIDDNFDGDRWGFADKMGVDRHHIDALCRDDKKPELELAAQIERETGGSVKANSWLGEGVVLLKKFIKESLRSDGSIDYKQKEELWDLAQKLGFMGLQQESDYFRVLYNKLADGAQLTQDEKDSVKMIIHNSFTGGKWNPDHFKKIADKLFS